MRKSVKEHATSAGLGSFLWLLIPIVALAAVLIWRGTQFNSNVVHKTIIKAIDRNPFSADGTGEADVIEMEPGDSTTIWPMLINNSSVPVYAIYVVDMPVVNFDIDGDGRDDETGLYVLGADGQVNDGWEMAYSITMDDRRIEVYGTLLEMAEESTLADILTMREIDVATYSGLDLNLSMVGYCVPAEGEGMAEDIGDAWAMIEEQYYPGL